RSLLVSLGLVLLLMGALSFLQKKVPGTERMTKESRRITNLPVREADRIDLTGPKGSFVFRKKAEGDWRLEKPIAGGADAVSVGQLLSEIQFVESLQTLPSGKKEESQLQTFGLGQPTRTLVVGTKEGELTIDTGRETPIAGGIYVRIRQPGRGEKIAVVQNQLAEAMDKDLTGWREKRVLPLQIPDVQELLLHQGTLEVDVIKKDGEWAILKPVEAQADPTDVANVLGELSSLKAASFVSDTGGDLALYGLNAPAQAFEVRTTATNRILQIGQVNPKETNQVFARVSDQPSVFLLPRAAIDSLGKMADRVRDKRVVTFTSAAQIQAVEFAGRGGDYRLERGKDTNRWTLQWAGNPRAADSARVDAWIVFLKEARANRFLPTEDPARLGLIKPRQTLTLFWAAPNGIQGTTNRVETLKFGDESKEDVFLQVSTTSGGMAVPLGLLRRIPETALGWLPLGIFPPDFGPVRGLIWAAGGVRKEYRSGADGRWRASGVGAPR
ncbi:MAG: DUF4340 domain-containing protein, partial [Verrucomicrobia bacterium]|nr:DUF4340 domain-containing protein [Verrucomicrobiota bacterium]